MSLTRSFLRGMALSEEQVNAIIEEHTASTDALKQQRDSYKAAAEQLDSVQAELDALKSGGSDWEEKYNQISAEFESYKNGIQAQQEHSAKENAYRAFLKDTGISDRYIDSVLRVADVDAIALTEDGTIADHETLAASVKEQFADFITETSTQGAAVAAPPANNANTVTAEQFARMGYKERLALYNSDPQTYNELTGG